ncbi:MAG: PAS domain S-box protein [bacterium]
MNTNKNSISVLLIEDNPGDIRLIEEMLREAKGVKIVLDSCASLDQGLEALSKFAYNVILLDLSLPDSNGFNTFIKVFSATPQIPIVVLTGTNDEELAIKSVRTGAQDYLMKGQIDSSLLTKSISYSIERAGLLRVVQQELIERKAMENMLRKVNRALYMLSECNGIIVQNNEEKILTDKICRAIIKIGEYQAAWIAITEQDNDAAIRPIAIACSTGSHSPEEASSWFIRDYDSPLSEAFTTGRVVVCADLKADKRCSKLAEEADRLGFRSSVILPLAIKGRILGVIQICSKEPGRFDTEELKLLGELKEDVTFAIVSIRTEEERKRMEEARLESVQTVRAIFESASDGILLAVAESGRFIRGNAAICRMLGYSHEELQGLSVADIHPAEHLDYVRAQFERQARGEITLIADIHIKRKDGTVFTADVNAAPLELEGRRHVVGIFRDITDRKLAEEALHESELRFRKLFEASPEAVMLLDPNDTNVDWPIIDCNEMACKMNGYSYEEIIGKSVDIINTSSGTREERGEYLEQIRRAGVMHLETYHRHRDGHIFPVEVSTSIVTFYGRELILGIDRDITERKQAEETLRLLSARNEAILSSVPDIIMEVDPNKKYTWANRAGIEFFGEDVIGKEADYYFEGEQDTYDIVQPLFIGDENIIYIESWQRRRDGEKRLLAWWCRVLKDNEGNVTGALSAAQDVTESKLYEEILKESEERYRTLFESAAEGILVADVEEKVFKYANPAICKMFGYTLDEIIQLGVYDIHPKESLQMVLDEFQAQSRNGKKLSSAIPCLRKDGLIFFAEINAQPVLIKGRLMSVGLFTDITERKQAEVALRESERKLREAQEMAHLGFWSWDVKTGEVEWSEEVFKIFNLDPETFKPQIDSIQALSPWPEDHQRDKELIQRAIVSHTPGDYEQKFLRPDNSIGHYYSTFQGNYNDNGDLVSIVGTVLDITERKQAEERLLKLNEELEQRVAERTAELSDLYNNAPCGYHSLNNDGIYERINDTELKWLGYTRDEIINKIKFPDLLTTESKHVFDEIFSLFKERGWHNDIEFNLIRKNGTILPVLLSATALKDEEGHFIRSRTTITDHTERKKAEEAIQEANVRLEESNKELEAFSYSISHDLRAPLRAMDGYARMLFEDYAALLDAEGQRLLNVVIMSAKNMGHLIDDLLSFSRISRQGIKKSRINMFELAKSVFDEIISEMNRDSIEFKLSNIPDSLGDSSMIRQVWRNLIGNSIKFSSKKPNAVIEVGVSESNNEKIYFVRDNGVGFDNQFVDKVFGVFQRLHKSSEFEGTGVGLAIVHRIIHRHGGKIWADGKLNEGATFYFTLTED